MTNAKELLWASVVLRENAGGQNCKTNKKEWQSWEDRVRPRKSRLHVFGGNFKKVRKLKKKRYCMKQQADMVLARIICKARKCLSDKKTHLVNCSANCRSLYKFSGSESHNTTLNGQQLYIYSSWNIWTFILKETAREINHKEMDNNYNSLLFYFLCVNLSTDIRQFSKCFHHKKITQVFTGFI